MPTQAGSSHRGGVGAGPTKRNTEEQKMKVWGFNCYGICIKRIEASKIDEWNATHQLANEKIVSWKE